MASLAHPVRASELAERTSTPKEDSAVALEPNITRDLAERAERMADSGCLAQDDADAIRQVLGFSRENPDDVPSFY